MLIKYNMWSSNHFSTSSRFPRFSGYRFLKVQVFQSPVFQGPGPGFRSSQNIWQIKFVLIECQQNVAIYLYQNNRTQDKSTEIPCFNGN